MPKPTWMPILGNAKLHEGEIELLEPLVESDGASPPPNSSQSAPRPVAVVRSSIDFDQGEITWETQLESSTTLSQILLQAEPWRTDAPLSPSSGSSTPPELSAGLNVGGAPYGFAGWQNNRWDTWTGAGHGSRLRTKHWFQMKVTAKGSDIDLFVEGVKVASTNKVLRRGPIGYLLQGAAGSKVRNIRVSVIDPLCFVVMQFTEEFDTLYQEVILPVCQEYGYKVMRADDFATSGQVMDDVINSIRSAALVIADVTPDNPNVFYEVGFAHAIDKPTILLSDSKREQLPFDIRGIRTLFYDNTIGGKTQVESRLRKHLDAVRPQ